MNTNVVLEIKEDESLYLYSEYVNGKSIESCGVFCVKEAIQNDTTHNLFHAHITEGDALSCAYSEKHKYACQWHSHPEVTGKWYPSIEDVMTMRKRRPLGDRIRLSLIYTTQGIWVLQQQNDVGTELPKVTQDSIYEYHRHLTRIYLLGSQRIKDLYDAGARVFPGVRLSSHARAQMPDKIYVQRDADLPGRVNNPVVMDYITHCFIPFVHAYFGVDASFHEYGHDIKVRVRYIKTLSLSIDGCPDQVIHESTETSNVRDAAIIQANPNPDQEVIFSYNMDRHQLTGRRKRTLRKSKRKSRVTDR
jgi:hypothetical protein